MLAGARRIVLMGMARAAREVATLSIEEYVERTLAKAPPLTVAQIARIRSLLVIPAKSAQENARVAA